MITGKNIVLTGCNSGIGLEVLKILVKGSNKILAVDKDRDYLDKFDPEKVTVMQIDVSSEEAVDKIFEKAEELFPFIDIFYANAGYPYYEEMNYTDWGRVQRMFETNVFSPIYSYQKYVRYLDGRKGVMAMTVSAIGEMAMPGFTIYSASKFALHGFQQGVRLEKPDNVQLTCLYPVATNTNFFRTANEIQFKKPFPVQQPDVVARKMVEGIESGKSKVSPCFLFGLSKVLMGVCPPVRTVYWGLEKIKFNEFKENIKKGTGKKWDE
ncbi:MAG: SDR family NAD(P)-dependent oxidoreductase [Clostridia bacterium]|nr:SDR family NAD(P)-dependent oxidoreductase [Clostridia bacterium]MBQ4244173.1 SDR family NAD(P)-dependent oxidoreductase [Clostridia bacterium]